MTAKIKSILFVLLYILIYLAAQTAAVLIPSAFEYLKKYSHFDVTSFLYELSKSLYTSSLNIGLVVLLSSLIASLFYFIIIKARKTNFIKKKKLTPLNLIAAVLITYGLNVVAMLVTSLKIFQNLIPEYSVLMDNVMEGNIFLTLLAVGIVAPVFEEFMNRGVILGELKRGFGFLSANIIQSLIFAVMHGNIIQGVYAFIIGFTLGLVYEKSGSIYIPYIIHILFNVTNVLISQFASSQRVLPGIIVILGIPSLIIGIKMLNKRSFRH